MVDIRVHRGLDVQALESAIDWIENRIRHEEPTIRRIFLEADSLKPAVHPGPPLRSDFGGLEKTRTRVGV
jgi:hypothetical protein